MRKSPPHPVDVHVGSRVRQARLVADLSQEKIADTLGLTFQQVQKYEKGTNRISASRLVQIAQAVNKPVAWFFEGTPGVLVTSGNEPDPVQQMAVLPYGIELAQLYVAIELNLDRRAVVDVARALARHGELPKRAAA